MEKTLTFNTLAYAERLQGAGFSHEQAKAQVEMMADVIENNLATKRDLKELEVALKRDIKETEMRLKIWIGSIMIIAIGVLATLQKIMLD